MKHSARNLIVTSAVGALITGCTTSLSVKEYGEPILNNQPTGKSQTGLPYPLNMTQFAFTIEYELVSCGKDPNVSVAVSAGDAQTAADPTKNYIIDPNSLASPVKVSSVKLAYHPNGSVKSLNATAEDKTADLIVSIGKTAVSVAKIVGGNVGSSGDKTEPENCTKEAAKALKDVTDKKPELEASTSDLKVKTAQLEAIKKKIEGLGPNVDEASKAELSKATDAVKSALAKQNTMTKAIVESKKLISYQVKLSWPEHGMDFEKTLAPPDDQIRKWITPNSDPKKGDWKAKLTLHFVLESLSGVAQTAGSEINIKRGVPFRQPKMARLAVCKSGKCGSADGEYVIQQDGLIQQLGQVYFLDCRSRPFSSVACSFEMGADGRLVSVGTENKSAALAEAAKVAEALAGNVVEIAALEASKAEKLKKKTDYLKAQADHAAALKALQPSSPDPSVANLASLKMRSDIALATIAALDAEAALQKKLGEQDE